MTTRQTFIKNKQGIHVRPAGLVAKQMAQFPGVRFEMDSGNGFVNAMGIMSLMTLELTCGKEVTVMAVGPNEDEACASIAEMLGGEFDCDKPKLENS